MGARARFDLDSGRPAPAATVEKRTRPDGTLVLTIAGKIDASFEPALIPSAAKVVVNLAEVRAISSLGIRALLVFFERLAQNQLVLVQLSPAVARQVMMIPNLVPPGAQIDSIRLPFVCDACGIEVIRSVPWRAHAEQECAPTCECGRLSRFDGMAEHYLPSPSN
jgi:anti-anti-sigma regulatory factor